MHSTGLILAFKDYDVLFVLACGQGSRNIPLHVTPLGMRVLCGMCCLLMSAGARALCMLA